MQLKFLIFFILYLIASDTNSLITACDEQIRKIEEELQDLLRNIPSKDADIRAKLEHSIDICRLKNLLAVENYKKKQFESRRNNK